MVELEYLKGDVLLLRGSLVIFILVLYWIVSTTVSFLAALLKMNLILILKNCIYLYMAMVWKY